MENNPSLRFYLNKEKARGNKQPLYFRITLNRKKVEISTKYLLESKEWNESSQNTRKNGEINQDLISMKDTVYDIVKTLEKGNKQVTVQIIKALLTGKSKFNTGLIESFDRYLNRLATVGEVSKETILHFGVTKKHLLNFLKEKKMTDFPIERIDYNFISDFDLFLCKTQVNHGTNTMVQNTRNKHHTRVRTILIRAIREGFITKNPYMDFKLKKIPANRAFLTEEELQLITEHTLGGNESLIKVRDIFIFSCYTALRFEDAQNLSMDNISKDMKGKFTLRIKQEKTDENIAIPLLPPALSIIKKYESAPERLVQGKVLPKFSNQKVNAYLKVIAELTDLKKNLTHHVARHTCATTILLSNEVPMEAVSKWLGHTDIKTTQIYGKITNDYLQKQATEKLEPLFNKH